MSLHQLSIRQTHRHNPWQAIKPNPWQAIKSNPWQAIIIQNLRTTPFPKGKGEMRRYQSSRRQHRNSDAVFIRQGAKHNKDKVFSSISGNAWHCRHHIDNGSRHLSLHSTKKIRQKNTVRKQATSHINQKLRCCIVQWRGQAISWLSAIVIHSITFRRFGLLLQNAYAASLIHAVTLFPCCMDDTSPEDDKSPIQQRKVQAHEYGMGKAAHTFLHASPKPLHYIPRLTIARLRSPRHRTMHHLRS